MRYTLRAESAPPRPMPLRWAALLPAAALLLACGGAAWAPFDRTTLPGADRWPDAPRIVLLDAVHVRYHAVGSPPAAVADVTFHDRVWYRPGHPVDAPTVAVGYQTGLRDLLRFEGRLIRPDGEEVVFDPDQRLDMPSYDGMSLFTDSRVAVYRPEVVPGTVVERRATVRYHDLRMWSLGQHFASESPALERRLEVEVPPGWQVRHRAQAQGADTDWAPETHATADGGRRLRWVRADVAPAIRERHAPPLHEMAPRVSVQLTRWTLDGQVVEGPAGPAQVSALVHALQAPRLAQVGEGIRARVEALLADVGPDTTARAARLHAFVRDEIRYVSIQLGMGGWIPHAPDAVFEAGYGDCKDQASLLGVMLAAAGIPSRQVTLFAHGGWPRAYGLPTVAGNANHQVLVVDLPDGPVIVDPTAGDVPFGEVPFQLQGAPMLASTAEGSPLETVPLDPPEANRIEVRLGLTLPSAGQASGQIEVTARGHPARRLRSHLRTERGDAAREQLDELLGLPNAVVDEVQSLDGVEPTRAGVPVELRGRARQWRVLGPADRVWSVSTDTFFESQAPRIDRGPRTQPIVLGPPRTRRDRVELTLPAERAASALPEPVTIETAFATYRLAWSEAADKLAIEREVVWRRPWLEPGEADALRAFADAAARAEARAVVLRPVASTPQARVAP